jgi:hypothetical protein
MWPLGVAKRPTLNQYTARWWSRAPRTDAQSSAPRNRTPAVSQDARHRQLELVVQDRARHTTEELEADAMSVTEGFAALRWIGLHQAAVAVRQIHREEVDLPLHSGDCCQPPRCRWRRQVSLIFRLARI